MGLVSKVLPKNQRTMGVSMHSLVRRVPMALGPLIGGLLIGLYGTVAGVRLAFVGALALSLVALVMQQILIQDDAPAAAETSAAQIEKNPLRVMREMSPDLRALLMSDTLIRFCEQIPYAFVVLYCVVPPASSTTLVQIPAPVTDVQFGLLRAIEMATAVLVYIPVAYFADRVGKKPFVVATFVFFALFPLALLTARSFWWLVPIFMLRGLKEFGEPTRKALIMDLAPEGRKAAMFGTYYLVRDTIVALAAFAGAFLWEISPATNLLTAFGFGVIGTIWFAWHGRDFSPQPSGAVEVNATPPGYPGDRSATSPPATR